MFAKGFGLRDKLVCLSRCVRGACRYLACSGPCPPASLLAHGRGPRDRVAQIQRFVMTTEQAEYVVVLRARSSAYFVPEEGWDVVLDAPKLGLKGIRVATFTRWVAEGGEPHPRELTVEVRGNAGSLDEALTKFGAIARPLVTMIGFVANVRVGPLQEHLAYDCTRGREERQFLQMFLDEERGAPAEGRIIRRHLVEAACRALICLTEDNDRVDRALRQYELALREWRVGGEWLALDHLWIAAENLTKAVIRKIMADRGISEADLAHSYDLVTNDPQRPRWREYLGQHVRHSVIFAADDDTYQTAKKASDGLEHGSLALDRIATHALKCTDKTFSYVRRAILELLKLPPDVVAELIEIKPKDVQSLRKVIRGALTGAADDPAAEGERYPLLQWSSGMESVVREGYTFQMTPSETITIHTHPDVGFQPHRFELYGRLEDGTVPVRLHDQHVVIKHTPPSSSRRLVASVMPLVNAAAATGVDMPQIPPSMYAFNLFGQAVAFFKCAQVLIEARQPVEALPALRGLIILAARFEQMTDPDGPGLGVAVRTVIDAFENSGADAALLEVRLRSILSNAERHGVVVPNALKPFDTTSICASLGFEMKLATDAVSASYGTVGLHMQRVDTEHAGFHVELEPGPFTDLVSTAAVIAMLELLRYARELFGWTLAVQHVDELLTEARALNETAVSLKLTPPDAE